MNPVTTIAVLILSMLGATAQGSIGIGYGLVAGAGLIAVEPAFVPGPLLIISFVVSIRHIVIEREHLDRSALKRCAAGLPVGLIAGLVVLEAMDDRTLSLAVGTAITIAAVALLFGFTIRRTPTIELFAGAASAFSSVTAGLPGPPFVFAFSDLKPAALRATSATFISLIAGVAFFGLLVTGNFGSQEFGLLAALFPGTLAGLFVARYVRPHLEQPWFRPLVLVVSGVGGLALIIRNL